MHITYKNKERKILQKSEVKNMNEYTVEKKYIEHMQKIGWKFIELKNYDELKINFRNQICRFNADKLIAAKGVAELSDAEFRRLLLQIENFDVITAAEH